MEFAMSTIERRTSPDGVISHRVKIRLKGHPVQTASFARLTDAKKWSQSTESAIREGRYFKSAEAKRHTLSDAIDRYASDVLPTKPKNQRSQLSQLEWWKARLGSYSLADVTSALISERRDELLKGITPRGTKRTPATVVRYMAAISHVFTIAIKEWCWIEDSPTRKVRSPPNPRAVFGFLMTTNANACWLRANNQEASICILSLSWPSLPACGVAKFCPCVGLRST